MKRKIMDIYLNKKKEKVLDRWTYLYIYKRIKKRNKGKNNKIKEDKLLNELNYLRRNNYRNRKEEILEENIGEEIIKEIYSNYIKKLYYIKEISPLHILSYKKILKRKKERSNIIEKINPLRYKIRNSLFISMLKNKLTLYYIYPGIYIGSEITKILEKLRKRKKREELININERIKIIEKEEEKRKEERLNKKKRNENKWNINEDILKIIKKQNRKIIGILNYNKSKEDYLKLKKIEKEIYNKTLKKLSLKYKLKSVNKLKALLGYSLTYYKL